MIKEKILFTGNPVRQDISGVSNKRDEAISFFGLDANKKTISSLDPSRYRNK